MGTANRFFHRHDVIAICGCFRFGSTALANTMAQFTRDSGYPVTYLNEFFAGHHYLGYGDDGHLRAMTLPVDYVESDGNHPNLRTTMVRPLPDVLFRAKMEWLRGSMGSTKIVLKIDPADWAGPNGLELERFILGDTRVYAMGLNRADVGNAIISYLMGRHFNLWNMDEAELAAEHGKQIVPVEADLAIMQEMYDAMLLHNNWLWYMSDRLDRLVWHDQVEDLVIPEIGLASPASIWTRRNGMPHGERARRYFTNHGTVTRMADEVQSALDGLIGSVRRRYGDGR